MKDIEFKLCFRLKNRWLKFSNNTTMLYFDNGSTIDVFQKNSFEDIYCAFVPIDLFKKHSFVFKMNNKQYPIEILESCKIILDNFCVKHETVKLLSINKDTIAITGKLIMAKTHKNLLIKCFINGNIYIAENKSNKDFIFNILAKDFLLDDYFTIAIIYNNEQICEKNFQSKDFIQMQKEKYFTYYFSQEIKQALNSEVFLFKNFLLYGNIPHNIINLLRYRNSVDRNVVYILALYIEYYFNKIEEFILLIEKVVNFEKNDLFDVEKIKKNIKSKMKIQDSLKIEVSLWEKIDEFVKKIYLAIGVKYTRHTVINIIFMDYYQVYNTDIINIMQKHFSNCFSANAFTKRKTSTSFKSISEKETYLLKNEKG